jgi:hypothetical protein
MGRRSRKWWILQAALVGLALGLLLMASLPPLSYTQDLQQDYLAARAMLDGHDPLTPTEVLARRYFPVPVESFPHGNPHPPVLLALFTPLALLPYEIVAFAWFVANLASLLVVGGWLGMSPLNSLTWTLWPPLWYTLRLGQLEVVLLLLAVAGWRAGARGNDSWAGLLFGVAASLKPYVGFFVLPFLARGRFRLVLVSAVVWLTSQAINLATVGPSGLARYYGEILPAISARYSPLAMNIAPYGALLRLLGGAADSPTLVDVPSLVIPLATATSLFSLLSLLLLPAPIAPLATFCALPLVWFYHPVLVIPQLLVLYRSGDHRSLLYVGITATALALPLLNMVLPWLRSAGSPPSLVPLATGMQTAGLLLLLALSWTRAGRPAG